MIFSLLKKYWRNLLDILIILVLIFFIFLINPWNVFGNGLKLNPTANMVTEIKSIGQLVTAEYYGEVVASLEEGQLNVIEKDLLYETGEDTYKWLKVKIADYYDSLVLDKVEQKKIDNNKSKARKQIKKVIDQVMYDIDNYHPYNGRTEPEDNKMFIIDTLDVVMMYLAKHLFNNRVKNKNLVIPKRYPETVNPAFEKKRREFRRKQIKELVYYVSIKQRRNSMKEYEEFLREGFEPTRLFTDFYFSFKQDELQDHGEDKAELSMIGRGWVKAGVDFEKLDEHKFVYSKETSTIHFFGIEPKILDTDINPWFIPEKEVPGFEVIRFNKTANFEHAKTVKQTCKRRLEDYAKKSGLIEESNKNAKELLKSFFGLLTGDTIKNVLFHRDALYGTLDEISKDSLIYLEEILIINDLISNYEELITKEEKSGIKYARIKTLENFIKSLKALKINFNNQSIPFNYYSRWIPLFLKDQIIDQNELKEIEQLRKVVIRNNIFSPLEDKDSIWFDNDLTFVSEYNLFLYQISKMSEGTYNISTDCYFKPGNDFNNEIQMLRSNSIEYGGDIISFRIVEDSLIYIKKEEELAADFDENYYYFISDYLVINPLIQTDSLTITNHTLRNKYYQNSTNLTKIQEEELKEFKAWVVRKNKAYLDRSPIFMASDWVRKEVLNKEKMKQSHIRIREGLDEFKRRLSLN